MTDTTQNAPELLPCPFCGGKPFISKDYHEHDEGTYYSYKCKGCGAKTKESYTRETCPIFYAQLRDVWNARADLCHPVKVKPLEVNQNLQQVPEVKEGYLVTISPVRWKAYKPQAQKQMKRKGRWQRMNEYAGWENCETPILLYPDFPSAKSSLEPAPTSVQDIDAESIIDELEDIISETHDIDVSDRNYAENIVGWLKLHHPAALRALANEQGGQ